MVGLALSVALALSACTPGTQAPSAAVPAQVTPAVAQVSVNSTISKAATSVKTGAKTAATDAQIAINAICTYYPLVDSTFQLVAVAVKLPDSVVTNEEIAVRGLATLCENPIADYVSALRTATKTYAAVSDALKAAQAAKAARKG